MRQYSLRADYGPVDSQAVFSIRMLKYALCWLLLWQDNMVPGSILQINELIGRLPFITVVEQMLAAIAILSFFERTLTEDFRIRRSYFSIPIIFILTALFFSWCRGSYINQKFAPVLEAHEAFLLPFAFLVVSNAFRDERDRTVLFRLIMTAWIPKSIEGLYIYFFSTADLKHWGVVQMWRDGYLLAVGVVTTMLVLHYKGTALTKIKRIVLLSVPFLGFTLIMSYRRTFILASVFSAGAMIISLPKQYRKKQIAIIVGLFVTLIFFTLITDPLGVLGRLSGIIEPDQEGSAYIRLMELPNVIQNILHNPILGVPVAVQWKQYFRMPVSAVYTTLGTHNTYLYWPLRTGLLGTIGWWWLLVKCWKTALINFRLRKNEEDFVYGQLSIHLMLIYQVACFFGLMYGDAMSSFLAVILTAFQLQSRHIAGRFDYGKVHLIRTLRQGRIVYKQPRRAPSGAVVSAIDLRPAGSLPLVG